MGIELVSRQSVFDANAVLARALYDWQKQAFDPTEDPFLEGQEAWGSDADAPITLTAEQAAEWNANTEAFFAAWSDRFDPEPPPLPGPLHYGVAEYICPDFESFAAAIAAPTEALFRALGWDRVLMVGFSRAPYLEQRNDMPAVAAAEARLQAAGLSRDYAGAMAGDAADAARFLADYFWLARCNAGAPYLYVSAPGAATLLVPCKYGNYHVESYGTCADAALEAAGFTLAPEGLCREVFSESGAIPGRQMPL